MDNSKTGYGCVLWLTKEELEQAEVLQAIKSMKHKDKAILFFSGKLDAKQLLLKLIMQQKE